MPFDSWMTTRCFAGDPETSLRSRGPRDLHPICLGRTPETEVKPEVVLRVIARTAHDLVDLAVPACGHRTRVPIAERFDRVPTHL